MVTTFRPKVWVGLTATLATGAISLVAAQAGHADHVLSYAPFQIAAGGEGGEGGGEGGGGGHGQMDPLAGTSAGEELEARLILMKGHLNVGHELYLAGLIKDATPHISHPSTELYGKVAPDLSSHGVGDFHEKLDALRLAFEAKATGANFETPYVAAVSAIDGALAKIDAKEKASPARLAYLVLNVAAGEYGNAFGTDPESDKVVAPIEYQDSLGFTREAQALVKANSQAFAKRDASALAEIGKHLDTLRTAWPSAAAPEHAPMSVSRFQSEVLTLTGLLKRFE